MMQKYSLQLVESSVSGAKIVIYIWLFLTFLLPVSISVHAQEPAVEQEEMLYQQYQDVLEELDREREEEAVFNEAWEKLEGEYRETWSVCEFGQAYFTERNYYPFGFMIARRSEDGDLSFKIMGGNHNGLRTWLYQERSGVIYIACSSDMEEEPDIPEYVLNFRRYFMYTHMPQGWQEDPSGRWDEWRKEHEDSWQERTDFPVEWLVIGEETYRIRRGEKRLDALPSSLEEYLPRWVQQQAYRIRGELLETSEEHRKVESLLEDRKNDLVEFACGDMNQDGRIDYAVELRKQMEGGYLSDFWIFLSDEEGYSRREIGPGGNHGIGFDFIFAEEEVIETAYFGFYPSEPTSIQYYRYCSETGGIEFFREYQVVDLNTILIHCPESIGKYGAEEFNIQVSKAMEGEPSYGDYSLHTDAKSTMVVNQIGYDDYTGRRLEYFILDEIKRLESLVANQGEEYIWSRMTYVTPQCFSGNVEGRALLIDRRSGKKINVAELIPLEEMLEICRKGIKDASGKLLTELKQESCLLLLQKYYDRMNQPSLRKEGDRTELSVEITHWGVKFTILRMGEEGEKIWDSFYVDKEHFYQTPLWYYLAPEGDPAAEAVIVGKGLPEEAKVGKPGKTKKGAEGTEEYLEYWEESYVTWKDETEELWAIKEYSFPMLSFDLTTTNPYWEGEVLQGWLKAHQKTEGIFLEILIREGEERYLVRYHETADGTFIFVEESGDSSRLPLFVLGEVELYRQTPQGQEENAEWELQQQKQQEELGEATKRRTYFLKGEKIYRIWTERPLLMQTEEKADQCWIAWICQEAERVSLAMADQETDRQPWEVITPEGYAWTGQDVVSDFNGDGQIDCVAALLPPEEDRQEIWLFASTPEGDYETRCICDTWELYCRKMSLDGEGRLVIENAIYGANRKDYFSFWEGDFFLEETIQWGYGSKQIKIAEELGEYQIEEYYRELYFATMAFLEEPSDALGWEEVEKVREILVEEIRNSGYPYEVRMEAFPVYENERISSMAVGTMGAMLPVLVDKETDTSIPMTELLTKEEFLKICREGMELIYGYEDVVLEETLTYLEEGYAHINTDISVTRAMVGQEPAIICYPDARGMRVVFLWRSIEDDMSDYRAEMFHIEKSYFMDTALWEYLYVEE